ncbi:MAG: hypothetical protein JEZ11_19470 [Desulfobacterales bacterium]|nr:hypothetical protein [Desulfobacterales bacterium]
MMSPSETARHKDVRPANHPRGTRTYFSARAERRLFFYLTLAMLAWGVVVWATGG